MLPKESSLHSSIRLQHAIQEYKKQQIDKSTLERKLNILKSKCEINKKKNKNVVNQLQKIKSVKDAYLKGKYEVVIHLFRFKWSNPSRPNSEQEKLEEIEHSDSSPNKI